MSGGLPRASLRLLTVAEVAAWLNVHPKTVRRLCKRANLPFHGVGGRIRFNEAQVTRWLEEREGGRK